MPRINSHLVMHDGQGSLTVFVDGEMYIATTEHPLWREIRDKVEADDVSVVDMFSLEKPIQRKFEQLSDRVAINNGQVFFDGDIVNGAIVDNIVRFVNQGVDDWEPLVNFLDKIMANPNVHSREQLYDWLNHQSFSITPDGNFVAYKGVNKTEVDGMTHYHSVNHGRAVVDGVEHNGAIPNNVGSVVTMPRSEVEFNPGVGCSVGLHAGTYNYAKNWANGALLEVEIDPRDVVSVPTDCAAEKIRVCRYVVRNITETQRESVVYEGNRDEYEGSWDGITSDSDDDEYQDYGY